MVKFHKAVAQLMEDRQAQVQRRDDPPILAQLLTRATDRVAPPERPLVDAFGRELFGKAVSVLLEASDLAPYAQLTVEGFRFLYRRGKEPIAVRVFTPDYAIDGTASPLTVVETVLDDRPFIVDTLGQTLEAEGGEIRLDLHPVLGVQRNEQGSLLRVAPPDTLSEHESFFHAEVEGLAPSPALQQLLTDRLRQVTAATDDYRAMRQRSEDLAELLRGSDLSPPWKERVAEAGALLDWLAEKNFVFLGCREYSLDSTRAGRSSLVPQGSGLGILRGDEAGRYEADERLAEERLDEARLIVVCKTRVLSPVHRLAPMDAIRVARVDASGKKVGETLLLGLFTSKAYSEPASDTPVLREMLQAILRLEGAVEESHDYKDLVSLFNSLPKEELFASRLADVHRALLAIASARPHGAVGLLIRADAFDSAMFATVIVARASYSTQLRERVGLLLSEQLSATVLHEHLALDERPQARLHYYLRVPADVLQRPPTETLERRLNEFLRTWEDELREQLAKQHPPAVADRLAAKYAPAFPPAYKAATDVATAANDVRRLEALLQDGQAEIELVPAPEGAAVEGALKLYLLGESIALSDFVPLLENLGLRVFGEDFVDLTLDVPGAVRIHTYFVGAKREEDGLLAAAPLLVDALHALRAGATENDRLNGLVLSAALDWRAIEVLRTYVGHASQGGLASRGTLIDALVEHPASTRLLFRLFAAKFDPGAGSFEPAARLSHAIPAAQQEFHSSLDGVESLVHDRILRALGAAVDATVRTSFYRSGLDGPEKDAVAIKLASPSVPYLPVPHPMFEAYVHAPTMEGIHLRAGRVARGGLRLSDRPDDFRAEILGLLKTQVVKNAVIVPVGAKGGFVVKQSRVAAPASPEKIEKSYRALVGALLSITDNLENERTVPPLGQMIYDDPDPYLVVAADKGTAGFSDVANEVAERYRFWLGDAFASGGTHGYDHKRLAITARGAWECARQHFREMGRDIDRETISVIGIGDMSGDVFGNGMLRSRRIRLRAAFNHRHVFLDPDPDPERSYWERERLFQLPRSGWNDYSPSCMSEGGGVFERNAKSIPLSRHGRAMLGVDAESLPGEEVVRAILRMEVDMLWNGGIGTYVKASEEAHAQVADPGNDRVRVDAKDLRVAVVVEGGNLGFTQRARVEFALRGGRINTDAIDNSAGVDCSDHEVNLKVALRPLVAKRELSTEERNKVLADLAEEVCTAVLAHNRSQALALGLDQIRSRTAVSAFRDLMATLEEEDGLDRRLEHLPTRDALRARRSAFLGLTRPELAVILALTKLRLQHRVLDSPLCEDPRLERYLRAYFPRAIGERFPHAVFRHPLRPEITAVELANRLVDTMGVTFLTRLEHDTGSTIVELVKGWTAVNLIGGAEETLQRIAARRSALSPENEQQCHFAVERALEQATKWVVATQPASVSLGDLVERFQRSTTALLSDWADLLPPESARARQADLDRLTALGLDEPLAADLTRLGALADALEISHVAFDLETSPAVVAQAYFQVATLVDLHWVRCTLPATVAREDRWEQRAIGGLLEELLLVRRQLTVNALSCKEGAPVEECVRLYAERSRAQLERVRDVIDDLKTASQPTLPGMLVVMRELGRLVRPGG